MGGERGNPSAGIRLAETPSRTRYHLRLRYPARRLRHRHPDTTDQRRADSPTGAPLSALSAGELSGTVGNLPLSGLLPPHPYPVPVIGTQLDEHLTAGTVRAENGSTSSTAGGLQPQLGRRVLPNPCPQFRLRHQQRSFRVVGQIHPFTGRRQTSRQPVPDRGHLLRTSRTETGTTRRQLRRIVAKGIRLSAT